MQRDIMPGDVMQACPCLSAVTNQLGALHACTVCVLLVVSLSQCFPSPPVRHARRCIGPRIVSLALHMGERAHSAAAGPTLTESNVSPFRLPQREQPQRGVASGSAPHSNHRTPVRHSQSQYVKSAERPPIGCRCRTAALTCCTAALCVGDPHSIIWVRCDQPFSKTDPLLPFCLL
jgi:hypothetical protein